MFRSALATGLVSLCLASAALASPDVLAMRAQSALAQSTNYIRSISTDGGYAGMYSLDLRQRFARNSTQPSAPDEITMVDGTTGDIGSAFLRAYRVTGEAGYLSAAAEVARVLAWTQNANGGWYYTVRVSTMPASFTIGPRNEDWCVYGSGMATQNLGFLIDLDKDYDAEWLTLAIEFGLEKMMEHQFEDGSWARWYPLRSGSWAWTALRSFNDGVINDCIETLLAAYKAYGRSEYMNAAMRGVEYMLQTQLPAPQRGWAQHYDANKNPVAGRPFEPESACSEVTGRNVNTLILFYVETRDERYFTPVLPAIEWLENSRIGQDLWARFYELGTNRPLYADTQGRRYYNINQLPPAIRNSYAWHGSFSNIGAINRVTRILNDGLDGYIAHFAGIDNPSSLTAHARQVRASNLAPNTERVISLLDSRGRWVRDQRIHARDFSRNANLLLDYLILTTTPSEGSAATGGRVWKNPSTVLVSATPDPEPAPQNTTMKSTPGPRVQAYRKSR